MLMIDPEYGVIIGADVADVVWDDLLGKNAKIIRINMDEYGNVGYWLDNDYCGGGRYPWEISQPRVDKDGKIVG